MLFDILTQNVNSKINVAQVRIARPTDKLNEIKKFYGEGLGLPILSSFENHKGYSGVMFGLPGSEYHLEFTHHQNGSPCPAPTKDNLLVFYITDKKELENLAGRIFSMGYKSVEPENPYWEEKGVTIEDPDGWRIVLMNTRGI
ncbi:MAG: VOC family protein [Bacteroidetes bacterium]|nr:VOC family protein [Bacteroidota bacterium]